MAASGSMFSVGMWSCSTLTLDMMKNMVRFNWLRSDSASRAT